MGRKMVRLQQFELNMRPIGFQDTPDSPHTVPRPAEPKLKGKGVKNLNCKNSGRAGRNFTRLSWRASTVTRSRWSSSWMLLCTARFSSKSSRGTAPHAASDFAWRSPILSYLGPLHPLCVKMTSGKGVLEDCNHLSTPCLRSQAACALAGLTGLGAHNTCGFGAASSYANRQ